MELSSNGPPGHPGGALLTRTRPRSPATDGQVAIGSLVAAAMVDPHTARDLLFIRLHPVVRRYCDRKMATSVRRFVDGEDITQEVLAAVHALLPGYQGPPERFLPMVYRIASNKVADHFRHLGRDQSNPTDDLPAGASEEPGPAESACAGETLRELGELVNRLSELQRRVVVLRVLAGLTSRETGAIIGATPEAVRVTQHRALQRLRTWLAETAQDHAQDRVSGSLRES
ncbi:sigma-70 family RNA polymerase sigma factor [Actinokineospora pegani]|uniref:sigma-70 family RNA polymerase sigma factor n=1 Tax=Actinokineospora pegani TaxID=2654637 RepID=UPI0012EADDE9|nr:sigma-70 family RNA polymerase sigma factor [Actinokineospora pegani]